MEIDEFWINLFEISAVMVGVCILLIPISHAEVFSYGTNYDYSQVVLPEYSYVHQGENISQGYYYDLSGVYGFSGELAHWNNDYEAGVGEPDQINNLDRPKNTFIDPAKWPAGRWWQWDGASCTIDGICQSGFGHGNAYVFAVVKKTNTTANKTMESVVVYQNITVMSEGMSIEIPVSVVVTAVPQQTPLPEIAGNKTVVKIPTANTTAEPTETSGQIQIVTPRSPPSILLPIIALIIGGVVVLRRR